MPGSAFTNITFQFWPLRKFSFDAEEPGRSDWADDGQVSGALQRAARSRNVLAGIEGFDPAVHKGQRVEGGQRGNSGAYEVSRARAVGVHNVYVVVTVAVGNEGNLATVRGPVGPPISGGVVRKACWISRLKPLSPWGSAPPLQGGEISISEGHPQTRGNPDGSGLHTPYFIILLGNRHSYDLSPHRPRVRRPRA